MALTDDKDSALATAAVAAAAGAAAYGLRKVLSDSGDGTSHRRDRGHDDDENDESRGGSLLHTVWDSASDTLLPLADDAADAAGKWVAENSPDVIRDRLLPRFIESFTDAA
jgi:hypothetical protein